MTVGTFGVRVVSAAALSVEAQCPRERLQESGLSGAVLADEERYRRFEVEVEVFVLEERNREGMNALLDPVLPQGNVSEEGAPQNGLR